MAERVNFWADFCESEDEDELIYDEPNEPKLGGGVVLQFPFTLAGHAIRTQGDFQLHQEELRIAFMELGEKSMQEMLWADFSEDLNGENGDEMIQCAARDMSIMVADSTVEAVDMGELVEQFAEPEDIGFEYSDEVKAALAAASAELSLDFFDDKSRNVQLDYSHTPKPAGHGLDMRGAAAIPPLAPLLPTSPMIALRLHCSTPTSKGQLEGRTDWLDILSKEDPVLSDRNIDVYQDMESRATSRSNTRPFEYGMVSLVFENRELLNVGSHGYSLDHDYDFELDFSGSDIALQELFAAPGGEGLTCATPSHTLHQMVSAVLSSAFIDLQVEVERNQTDISMPCDHIPCIKELNIDITTSAGIWNKTLRPERGSTGQRTQAAVSKYDIGAAIMSQHEKASAVRTVFMKAIACSLACEYPAVWRVNHSNVPRDLQLQSQVYETLAGMSVKKLKLLSALSYEVAVDAGLEEALSIDIYEEGLSFMAKRDILLSAISQLRPRNLIAIPPLAVSEITSLPMEAFAIELLGNDFRAGPYITQGRRGGPRTTVDMSRQFLAEFPACGLVTHQHAKEIADMLDDTPIKTTGLTHEGPGHDYQGGNEDLVRAVNKVYSASATAQFAEIRSDLVRAIYKNPIPGHGTWVQTYLYKGKVSAWYRCRDNPTSPDGYRIDWFAVSAFEVLGSKPIKTQHGANLWLWPRQRMRSQEMRLAHMGPRRLKAMLYSLLEKSTVASAKVSQCILAWERLAMTMVTSTWASGANFLTCRHLSSTISSPSSPFHEMRKKLKQPKTFADIAYLQRLAKVLKAWVQRSQYRNQAAILGLPRSYCQAESYWMIWVPNEFADSAKNMAECVIDLQSEASLLSATMGLRCVDLESQLELLTRGTMTYTSMLQCLKSSCSLMTGEKLGWSWIGSLASGHALSKRSNPGIFDRRYGRGIRHRTMVDHMTVRHSARIDSHGQLVKGTVAEMMLEQGTDNYMSTVDQTYRFIFVNRPVFFNHPKNGEHKQREISITDPDSRICLSDAELICGMYGRTTGIDYLKDPGKNSKFYRTSSRILQKGGGIQSSDATRYGPNMSNFAIAIMLVVLGTASMHLRWASVVYARLAFREMLIPTDILPELEKKQHHPDTRHEAAATKQWVEAMGIRCYADGMPVKSYTTSHHMGQGMSHHSSSLLHAGGIATAVDGLGQIQITVDSVDVVFNVHIMVTSDDSTILPEPNAKHDGDVLNRRQKQTAARVFLQLYRAMRAICLRMVSILANLVKEIISGVKGEFNSQDTGIGGACPILGFRELISLIVPPSAPSLLGDYLTAHAAARDIAFTGQGVQTANLVHILMIDAIEERWGLTEVEKAHVSTLMVVPYRLTRGCTDDQLIASAASWLDSDTRAFLYKTSMSQNISRQELDPHVKDTIFGPLMHIKVSLSQQHRKAISLLKIRAKQLEGAGYHHASKMVLDGLRSTLSSARTRNLGRIAFRVRNRQVQPPDYLDKKFERDTMLNATLNWWTHLNELSLKASASASDLLESSRLAGYVISVPQTLFGYPRPPELKKPYMIPLRKPVYVLSSYGTTPFGRHAIDRAAAMVVDSIGIEERRMMLRYYAMVSHRMLSEHIRYGQTFINSWARGQSSIIVAIDVAGDIERQKYEHILKGDFSSSAISKLQEIQREHPDRAVLAMHYYDGAKAMWHAIYHGRPYTVTLPLDLSLHQSDCMAHTHSSGQPLLLAFQGLQSMFQWNETMPTAEEISSYQDAAYDCPMPDVVRSVENQNMSECRVQAATYATEILHDEKRALIYVAPDTLGNLWSNPTLRRRTAYMRGKVVADLATAAYWHSALRGVAFRAYVKGHWYANTVWTGRVLGWKLSSTSPPYYYSVLASAQGVKGLVVLNGLDDPEMLTPYNTDIFSPGYKVMYKDKTTTYSNIIKVDASYVSLILACNEGQRFHVDASMPKFLDMRIGRPPSSAVTMTPMEAQERILAKLNDVPQDEGW